MKNYIIALLLFVFAQTTHGQNAQQVKTDQLLTAYHKLNLFNGTALVYQNGKSVLVKSYGYKNFDASSLDDRNSIYQIASVTKTFTSTLILQLVQQKKLSLTDKLNRFYPHFPNGDKINIQNLLTHTSGVSDYTHDDTAVNGGGEKKMMHIFSSHKLDFEPGTQWSYSNSGYSILGYIIQKVTGMPYEQAVRKYIFQRADMTNSGFDFEHLSSPDKTVGYAVFSDSIKTAATFSDSSVVFAAGAIYTTVNNLYKFHQALQSYKLVSKALLDKAYTPFMHNYGFGWITDTIKGKKVVYHSGGIAGFSSLFMRIPSDNVCIVLLNNKEGTELENIGRKILKILYNQPYTIPAKKAAIVLPEILLAKYVGTYELENPHIIIEVKLDNGKLMAHAVDGPTFELVPESENLFAIAQQSQVEIEFTSDEKGIATQLLLHQNDQKNVGKKIK